MNAQVTPNKMPMAAPSAGAVAAVQYSQERVLIFDMNNEYGEYGIKTISVDHIEVFNVKPEKEIRRIVPFRLDQKTGKVVKLKISEMLDLLAQVIERYKGGMLLIEDPTKFMGRNMSDDIIGSICTNRHSSVDVIMHYQSISRPLPVIHENCNIYRFHHQADDVYRSEKKLEEATEAFKLCQILVDQTYFLDRNPKHPCKRMFVFYNKDMNLILGDFKKDQFQKAIDEYIEVNPRLMKQWLSKREKSTGELVYNHYKDAHAALSSHLYDTYYGNDIVQNQETREALFMVASGLKGVGKTRETMRMVFEDYCLLPLPPIFHKKAA